MPETQYVHLLKFFARHGVEGDFFCFLHHLVLPTLERYRVYAINPHEL